MPQYQDFFLIVNGKPGDYTVEARGPGQIAVEPVRFVYEETPDIRIELNRIKEGFAPSRERMQKIGMLLFEALFPRSIAVAFANSRPNPIAQPDTHLRIKLIIRPPELSHLPWELLYDVDQKHFMAARPSYPIVRFVESNQVVAKLLSKRPLRVLYVQANPSRGTQPLDVKKSETAIRAALGEQAIIDGLYAATPEALRVALHKSPGYHVLHYDGHGTFETESSAGYLCLDDGQGGVHQLSGEMLEYCLADTSTRLVVLSACETAMDSKQKRFSGIAQQLMYNSKLPAAIAMQYAIPDRAAITFNSGFYKALAADYPVDAAVIEARQAILFDLGGDEFASPEWATPVLFMRSENGNILEEDLSTIQSGAGVATTLVEQEIGQVRGQNVGHTASGPLPSGGSSTVVRQKIDSVEAGGTNVGAVVNTGSGNLHVGGQQNYGDNVMGDKISVGNISNSKGIAIGRGAQANINEGLSGEDIARLFATVYQRIESRPEDPKVEKQEIAETVQKIETEAAKGDKASPDKVERWLKNLVMMAPDILDVTVATLLNPAAGVATVIRKVAEKAKTEAGRT
jgi:hypothetical protein